MSLIAADYRCPSHGVFESLESRPAPDALPCPACGAESPWCYPAPFGRCDGVSVVRGGVAQQQSPMWLNTRPLAEGMSMTEWRASRDKVYEERRHAEAKDFDASCKGPL